MNIELKEVELDGKKIAYSNQTNFYVEVGRYKGAYKVKYHFIGNIHQAVFYYRCLNIGNGYKKRLSMEDKILCRYIS